MNAKYGLLVTHTDNIGDEIQGLAARQFLPRVDYEIDRDRIDTVVEKAEWVKAILNGWWSHAPENWPPAQFIEPLITSFHISPFRSPTLNLIPSELFIVNPTIKYLRAHGPIGARDLGTLELLQKAKIDSFFSGCMTLTLQRRDVTRDPNLIVLNDLPEAVVSVVKGRTTKNVVQTRHAGYAKHPIAERYNIADKLLEVYSRASCVVTNRLHCALPCVAMGTPVLLLDTADDPKRFAGLHDFVQHMLVEEFVGSSASYDVNHPPVNPGRHLPYRVALIDSVKKFLGNPQRREGVKFTEADYVSMRHNVNKAVAKELAYLRSRASKTA